MKRTILLAVLAMASAAWAQAPAPTAKEPAKTEAANEPAKAEAAKQPAKAGAQKRATVAKKSSRRQQDARHCLERGNNMEIIKCAEAYL